MRSWFRPVLGTERRRSGDRSSVPANLGKELVHEHGARADQYSLLGCGSVLCHPAHVTCRTHCGYGVTLACRRGCSSGCSGSFSLTPRQGPLLLQAAGSRQPAADGLPCQRSRYEGESESTSHHKHNAARCQPSRRAPQNHIRQLCALASVYASVTPFWSQTLPRYFAVGPTSPAAFA